MIELKDISYSYANGYKALDGINLRIAKGEKIVVAGQNGAGKSTLFLILNALLEAREGSYFFDGKKVNYHKKELIELRKNIGIVFQDTDNQLFSVNVVEELAFGPLNLKLERAEVDKRIEQALRQLNIEELRMHSVHTLSSGQKKRVAIASVLTMHPEVLILDEPTASVDPAHAMELMQLFDSLHKEGKTILISTHDMNFAFEWADRIIVMNEGKIVCDGGTDEVFSQIECMHRCKLEIPLLMQIQQGLTKKPTTVIRNTTALIDYLNS